jgi:23S rRNA (uridine2552-2'-O)-methyltransferase
LARNKGSSHRWRQRQSRDPYVEKAAAEGWRSRAAFKLTEIDARERLFKPGAVIVDLGAAPGGWCQVASRRVGARGRVLAIDRLAMDPIDGVEFLQADFLSEQGLNWLREQIGDRAVDIVISDLAPNISGNRAIDQPRSMALVEAAIQFAEEVLKPGGCFLTKLFQGEGQREIELVLRERFQRLKRFKPKASRPESREIYLLACNYRMV